MQKQEIPLNLDLWPKQLEVLNSPAQELFYGGAAGGGKSHIERVAPIVWCSEIPGLQVYFFRRYHDDLIMNHVEGPTGFRALLEPWIKQKWVEIVEGEIRFKAWKSKIFLRHCQYERDLPRLLGPEIHVLCIEEAGQFFETMIRFIRGRMRIPDTLKIPDKYLLPEEYWANPSRPESSFPKAIYTSNPGGPGHAYLKKAFVTPSRHADKRGLWRAPVDDGGMLRQFIAAKLEDNPSIDKEKYTANLQGLGSPQLVKALLHGDWDAVVGAFFQEIEKPKHLIKPFVIPSHFPRMMAMDWGAAGSGDPYAIGWWTVSDGSVSAMSHGGTVIQIPRGALINYRRWSGHGQPKTTASAVARGILSRELKDGQIISRVAGGDILEQRGHGESIFEIFAKEGVHFSRADMRRESGWNQIRERATGRNEIPMIYFFSECEDALERVMSLQHDTNDPNDCMEGDDHDADEIRYMCMSRPWHRDKPKSLEPLEKRFKPPTIDELWALRERNQRDSR